jgi:hypothetical protein
MSSSENATKLLEYLLEPQEKNQHLGEADTIISNKELMDHTKLGTNGLIRDQRYRTDHDAGMLIPDKALYTNGKLTMPD